jgi:hypothetical protein
MGWMDGMCGALASADSSAAHRLRLSIAHACRHPHACGRGHVPYMRVPGACFGRRHTSDEPPPTPRVDRRADSRCARWATHAHARSLRCRLGIVCASAGWTNADSLSDSAPAEAVGRGCRARPALSEQAHNTLPGQLCEGWVERRGRRAGQVPTLWCCTHVWGADLGNRSTTMD